MKQKLIISACLLGINCRYDGENNGLPNDIIKKIQTKYELIPLCPEQLGGLSTPRTPCEIRFDGRIIDMNGKCRTENFIRGAEETAAVADLFKVRNACLKAHSPSCGINGIYDGSFSGTMTDGMGKTAEILAAKGITLISENELSQLIGGLS